MVPTRPTNDTDRRILIKQFLRTAKQDRHVLELIPNYTLDYLTPIVQDFCKAVTTTQTRLAVYRGSVGTKNRALRALAQYTLHFMNALKRRTRRESYSADVVEHYGLRNRSQTPHNHESRHWLHIAEDLIRGDAWAVEQGYQPIREPHGEELATKLEAARRACLAFTKAESELLAAQRRLKALRQRVDRCIKYMLVTLKHYLLTHGFRKAGIRRHLVRYGFELMPRPQRVLSFAVEYGNAAYHEQGLKRLIQTE